MVCDTAVQKINCLGINWLCLSNCWKVKPWFLNTLSFVMSVVWVRSQNLGFNSSICGFDLSILGFDPSILCLDLSILWVRSQHLGFNPSILGFDPSILGSIPFSFDTVEYEGRQIKQCWIPKEHKKSRFIYLKVKPWVQNMTGSCGMSAVPSWSWGRRLSYPASTGAP